MKLNVKKLQQGNKLIPKGQDSLNTETLPKIKNFWGFKDGQYTKDYLNTVESIINNPQLYNKAIKNLNVNSPDEFRKLATDYTVGPVHKSVVDNRAKGLYANFHVQYKNQFGTNATATPRQIIAGNKDLYDGELVNYNNDSTKAFNSMITSVPSAIRRSDKPQLTAPNITPNIIQNNLNNPKQSNFTKKYFGLSLKNGGKIDYINHFVK